LVATALLYTLSPVRVTGNALRERTAGSNEAIVRAVPALKAAAPAVSLTQLPLVMRVGKDEFRVAFGIKSVGCAATGCHGVVRYRVQWRADDGTTRFDIREVDFAVAPNSADRTITVDRQYFDTAEGAHTTDVVQVTVDRLTCHPDSEDSVLARNANPEQTLQPIRAGRASTSLWHF
jgi:hypothetical protein